MNSGIIAARYARALVKYVQEHNVGNAVYAQAGTVAYKMIALPNLRDYIQRHSFSSDEEKISIIETALGEPLVPEFKNFIKLVIDRKRIEFFTLILSSFIDQYEEKSGIKSGTLILARPEKGLVEKLEKVLNPKTYSRMCLYVREDPSLIGGFIFDMNCLRLDASVKHKLDLIRHSLVDKTNRII